MPQTEGVLRARDASGTIIGASGCPGRPRETFSEKSASSAEFQPVEEPAHGAYTLFLNVQLYEDQQKIADMTANSTNSFLEAWSALVEAVRNGDVKHVSKLFHAYPTITSKVMAIGVLLGT